MSLPREALHQPPNPVDLRRVPPASPDCARVRGWARDYVDGDLEPELGGQVEAHVQACRTCAVELSRTEHERLLMIRALGRRKLPPLPQDFAARVVSRLLRDETATLDATASGGKQAAGTAALPRSLPSPRRARASPVMVLLGALAVLCGAAFLIDVLDQSAEPQRHARLVVIAAEQSFHRDRLLSPGDGLGNHELLRVGAGGGARVEWHDASDREQPAAILRLHGKSRVQIADGMPVVGGRVDLATHRPVTIPLSDGSAIELGVGDYSLSAEPPPELLAALGRDELARAMPKELLVEIEVLAGEPARILRPGHGPTLVAPGFLGVYQGRGATTVVAAGGGIIAGGVDAARRESREPQPSPSPITSRLFGRVVDENGVACAGAEVLLSLEVLGLPFHASRVAGPDGAFQLETQGDLSASWSMVAAMPPATRPHLGVLVPDVMPLVRTGHVSAFPQPLRLRPSLPLRGLVLDDSGQVRDGVVIVPCVVDDAFGLVLPLHGQRTRTDAHGAFQLTRLPATLPPQQSLRLLFVHHELAPVVVDVPPRASALASSELPAVELRRLRWVRLDAMPANNCIDLLEEVAGLPAGTGLVRRTVFTDDSGVVPLVQVGWERVWARYGGATTAVVRRLECESIAGVPLLRPAAGTVMPLAAVFQPLQVVPDTAVEVANSYRHQRIGRSAAGAGAMLVQVVVESGQPAAGAQVFAVGGEGARGRGLPRFLGLTDDSGRLPLGPGDCGDLVVIATDGSVQFERVADGDVLTTVVVAQPGRAVLAPHLRQAAAEFAVEFERCDWPLSGPAPVFIRHVGEANGWEVTDLLPGQYLVRIGMDELAVDVPSGGFVVIGA